MLFCAVDNCASTTMGEEAVWSAYIFEKQFVN